MKKYTALFGIALFACAGCQRSTKKVIGVVSEADLLTKEALDGGYDGMPGMITGLLRHKEQAKERGITAGDLMTSPAATITPDETVESAARLMRKNKVKRLPVIDGDGRLTGIVSLADVLSVFDRSDDEIRGEIAVRDRLSYSDVYPLVVGPVC